MLKLVHSCVNSLNLKKLEDTLVEIYQRDLQILQDLYKSNVLKSYIGFMTLKNYVGFFKQDPNVKHIIVN